LPVGRVTHCALVALSTVLPATLLLVGASVDVTAQTPIGEIEFTRPGLLIVNFTPAGGAELKLGKRTADVVRSRVEKLVNKKGVEIYDGSVLSERNGSRGIWPRRPLHCR